MIKISDKTILRLRFVNNRTKRINPPWLHTYWLSCERTKSIISSIFHITIQVVPRQDADDLIVAHIHSKFQTH
ncbi:hypothetical protein Hanom_Chr12g01125931 [Helianthus anomalus]